MDSDRLDRARRLLRRHFGHAHFRPPQEAVVRAVLGARDVLGVLPTGAGKSVCFQVPALLESGVTVVVSPLISLMEDQVRGARRRGLAAASLTSVTDRTARRRVEEALRSGRLKLLYVSPERLAARSFRLLLGAAEVSRVAVDEAHCISEWGHDFRPSYRRIADFRRALSLPPVVALTATATPAVRADIAANLELRDPVTVLESFDRPNLFWAARRARSPDAGARALTIRLRRTEGQGLVYLPTRRAAERLAEALRRAGISAAAYHAGLPGERRSWIQAAWLAGKVRTVCATNAFGMGIDHPRVRIVGHLGLPASLEALVQEAGRGGRDGGPADALLIECPGDLALQRQLALRAWPSARTLRRVWDACPPGRPIGPSELRGGPLRRTPPAQLESALRLLLEFGCARPVAAPGCEGRRIVRGPPALRRRLDLQAPARGRRRARARLRAVRSYVAQRSCRRESIAAYFGEPPPACGRCDRCVAREAG